MPADAKVHEVESLKARLDGATAVILTEYRGLTVQQLGDLRKHLRAASAQYKVAKNRLARLAMRSSPLEGLSPHLTGPTGMIVSRDEPVAVAKALQAFLRTNQVLTVKAGFVEGRVLPGADIKAMADLPGKEALRSQLVGAIQGPLAQLVGLLTAPQRELVYILEQRGQGAAQ